MGNQNGKESHNTTGSPLDFFHTPPTTPSDAELTAMALSSAAPSNRTQTPSPTGSSTTPSATTSPLADWTQKLPAPSEWAVISVDSTTGSEANVSDAAARSRKAELSPGSPVSRASLSEQNWQERDSGVEPQAAAERASEEMTLVLLSLMEHYRSSLGLSPNTDLTTGAVELLRRLITQKDELVEEVDTLKETLRTERQEWQQFQCDLQVAVSVADRLRMESEQALSLLQENHRAVKEQLAQALSRQQEKEQELESLRAEHRNVCLKLTEFSKRHKQERAELDALRNSCKVKDSTACEEQTESRDSEEEVQKALEEVDIDVEKQKENEASQEEDHEPEEQNGSENLKGKGVAEGYLRSLAALEKKKDEVRGPRDPRRIAMLSERSWSLSRLPLPTNPSNDNGNQKNTSTTLPLCKKEELPNRRRMDRALQRQDSWSNFYTGKQDEEQSSDFIKAQDGFSALLRRHGGSRRNSLLRWCQSRTQGYKNIEITNFSSSWEDGLAFCAVYHTFLPTCVPYDTLKPTDKKENLDLAFKTGESVGITATLTVEEMLKTEGPDWQKVLGYVESIFRHFEM